MLRTTTVLCLASLGAVALNAGPLQRPLDPVVLSGAELPMLIGQPPERIVAFGYQSGWRQIPVQVDERVVVDYGQVYGTIPVGLSTLAYADPNTFTGPDPDPSFDADDELVFMVADAGGPAAAAEPPGVVPGSGVQIRLTDPLDGRSAYVYLFVSDGSLDPSAGRDDVAYTFHLLSGSYIQTYNTLSGPNPEDSWIQTDRYRTHFSDRWIRDVLEIHAGASGGVDILDHHKVLFEPGNCGRSEQTFSEGEGAFFANIDGPVRAIRSYLGANSGPLTQRDHFFYRGQQRIVTYLRVHPIPSIMDFYDYSPAAAGMVYYDNLNPGGVVVDGVPDAVQTGTLSWQLVTGPQGSLTIVLALQTDIAGLVGNSYYSDDLTPSVTQCTGDGFEYAASGPYLDQSIPNTDPLQGAFNTLIGVRSVYYDPPGFSPADAQTRAAQLANPLLRDIRAYVPPALQPRRHVGLRRP